MGIFKVVKIKLNGIWFLKGLNQVQCASCLYVQPAERVDNKNGVIIGWKLNIKDEQHSIICSQVLNKLRYGYGGV